MKIKTWECSVLQDYNAHLLLDFLYLLYLKLRVLWTFPCWLY